MSIQTQASGTVAYWRGPKLFQTVSIVFRGLVMLTLNVGYYQG